MRSPCLNCEERELGCHGKCPKYILYVEQINVEREKRIRENDTVYGLTGRQRTKRYRWDKEKWGRNN